MTLLFQEVTMLLTRIAESRPRQPIWYLRSAHHRLQALIDLTLLLTAVH